MTTCPFCLDNMASRSQRELTMRKARIERFPQVKLSECPHCKGTEWATTDYMIEPDDELGVLFAKPVVSDNLRRAVMITSWIALVLVMLILILPRLG